MLAKYEYVNSVFNSVIVCLCVCVRKELDIELVRFVHSSECLQMRWTVNNHEQPTSVGNFCWEDVH